MWANEGEIAKNFPFEALEPAWQAIIKLLIMFAQKSVNILYYLLEVGVLLQGYGYWLCAFKRKWFTGCFSSEQVINIAVGGRSGGCVQFILKDPLKSTAAAPESSKCGAWNDLDFQRSWGRCFSLSTGIMPWEVKIRISFPVHWSKRCSASGAENWVMMSLRAASPVMEADGMENYDMRSRRERLSACSVCLIGRSVGWYED